MKDFLPHECNLLENFDLKGGGPRTMTRPESTKGVVVGDGGSGVEIENH